VDNLALAKRQFHGNLIINDSYTLEEANAAIDGGEGDLVSFGRLFISNPDLAQRFKLGAQLARLDPATLYTPGAKGFIDYPVF
jgi:N-ethylmaleimide reductase